MNKKNLPELTCVIPKLATDIDVLADGNKLLADRVRVLLHNIYSAWIYADRIDENKNDEYHLKGWVNISASKLQSLLTQNYECIIKFCEESKLIQVKRTVRGTKSYIVNERSTPYRINPNLLPTEGKRYRKEKITEYKVIKAVSAYSSKKRTVQTSDSSNPLLESMLGDFCFDLDKVDSFIEDVLTGKIKLDRKTIRGVVDSHYLCSSINEGQYYTSTDRFGERFHTPFTHIPREIRPFLRLRNDSEPLCMVDIANSQPYFISVLLNSPLKLISVLPECEYLLELLHNEKRGDKRLFQELSVNGNIYEYLSAARNLNDRNHAKKEIIEAILFSNHNYNQKKHEEARKCFAQHFAEVWKTLINIKSAGPEALPFIIDLYTTKRGKFDCRALHKNVSMICQRLESRILIGKVAVELANNFSVSSFLTIHDSFVIKTSDEKIVRETISQCFHALGLPVPKMKTTYYP